MNTAEFILCTSDLPQAAKQNVSLHALNSWEAAVTVKDSLTVQVARLAADTEDVKVLEEIGKKVAKRTPPRRKKS